jgi:tetratricopeptide (TPR) repeat protein
VSTLREELGVDPAHETTADYNQLTSERPAVVSAMPAMPSRGKTFVGRAEEWDRLTALWPDGSAGSARLVLVTGEPGIGKTRLADTFASWCARRGAAVGRARSFPAEGDLGFGLVISWLRCADFRESLSHIAGSDLDLLTRLLPELGDGAELLVDYSEQRRRLFDVVARVLSDTGDRPTVLIADDAQWADDQSVQAMHRLVRHNLRARVLVVATVRREDLADDAAINAVAAGLASVDQLTEVTLARLSRAECEALARDLVDGDLTDRSIDQLHADSEGNPLFIVESIRAGWRPDEANPPLSPKLRGVITTRVAQLASPTREVLELAVTVGREFAVALVREASNLDDVAIVQALDELWRRGIVREYSTDAYDFTHGKIREAVYEGLSPAARRSNHRRIAQAHLVVDAGSLDSVSGRIAYHCDHGGLADDAVTWYLRAAHRAQLLYANEEAVRLLDRALEIAPSLPDDQRLRRELDILSALPTPLALVDSFTSERIIETQQRAVDLATELGIDPQPSVLRSLALMRLCQNQFDETASIGRRLRGHAEGAGDENLMMEAEYLVGIAAFWDGAFDVARERFELVVNDFPPALRAEHLVRFGQDSQIICLSRLANTLRFLGHIDDAIETRRAAVAQAKELGHPWTLSLTLIFASMLAVDLEEGELLQELADTLAGIELPTRPNRLHTQAILGTAQAFAGRGTEGIAQVRAAIDECGPVNPAPGFRSTIWRLLVAAHQTAGDPVGGLDAACVEALRVDGTRIWWPDIERARGTTARRRH